MCEKCAVVNPVTLAAIPFVLSLTVLRLRSIVAWFKRWW